MVKIVRFLTLLSMLALLLMSFSVCAEPADTDTEIQELPLVAEANAVPDSVYYYNNTNQYTKQNLRPTQTVFAWENGRNGAAALRLNGQKQYLRLRTSVLNELDAFTLSTWVNWGGNVTDSSPENQPFFTFFSNQYHYLAVFMHAADPESGLDGPCIKWAAPNTDPQVIFHPVEEGTTFAFPRNEWHHLAVSLSETKVVMYVDGVPYLRADVQLDFAKMRPPKLYIGSGFGTEPTLNAALQGASLYTGVLTDTQVSALANDADPLGDSSTTPTTQSLATRPSTTTSTVVHKDIGTNRVFGLPLSLVITMGAFILLIVILSITFSVRNASSRTTDTSSQDEEGSTV